MLRCHCGGRFNTHELGVTFVEPNAIYSADMKKCECGATVFDLADHPYAVGAEAKAIAERIKGRGLTIYGKGE